jgi:L-lactate dehydrogenase complex protein LldG
MATTPKQARTNMLLKIKQALQTTTPVPFLHNHEEDYIQQPKEPLITIFENVFTSLQGKFALANSLQEKINLLKQICLQHNFSKIYCADKEIVTWCHENDFAFEPFTNIADCDVSITQCESLVARTGSMLLSSGLPEGRTSSIYAPVHICLATQHQLVFDIKDALEKLQQKYGAHLPSFIGLASGPSRTADIEKTLVVGVHGPKEVYCIVSE